MTPTASSRSFLLLALLATAPVAAQTMQVAEPLPAGDGWRADRIHHSDAGVWYLHVDDVVADYGQHDVIAADDKGRFLLLTVYSGQWTANSVVPDGLWLAPTRSVDVDPRAPGRELYAGGRGGSLHRVTLRPQPFAKFTLESVEIGHRPGEEFHAVVAGDFAPTAGDELLAFAITGAVFQLVPSGDGAAFTMPQVASVPGRVRDVVVVPGTSGEPATLLGVSRAGHLLRMQLHPGELRWTSVLQEDSGLGRIAAAKGRPGVFYATRDDGAVVRIALAADGRVERSVVYAGGQGLRGVASGRFFADDREAFAVYGYDKAIHVVHRRGTEPWQAETVLTTTQKGHWLTVGELDGRNGTDELVASGFDGDVILVARPPGYALPGAAVPIEEQRPPVPGPTPAPTSVPKPAPDGGAPKVGVGPSLRVAGRIGARGLAELSPLRYFGGFETKTLVYETLVQWGNDGRLAPGLASSWRVEENGKAVVLTLRDGATWSDGRKVTAAEVAVHCRRWLGLPEHAWLRSAVQVQTVRATGPRELRFELEQPAALLADLTVVNPAAVTAPACHDRDGNFVRPVGSGPFVVVGPTEGGKALRYQARDGARVVDVVRFDGDPLDALLAGEVDAVVGSDLVAIEPARAAALRADPRFQVLQGEGSAMWLLTLRWQEGPLADPARRARVAAAIDRDELVRVAAAGFGQPRRAVVAPVLRDWPEGTGPASTESTATFTAPLRLQRGKADPKLVESVVGQLRRAGVPVEATDDSGTWDLRIERTHGLPYDPFHLLARWLEPSGREGAAGLEAAVAELFAASDPSGWPAHFGRVQHELDEFLPMVGLFAPARLAVLRAGLATPRLTPDLYRLDAEWLQRGS